MHHYRWFKGTSYNISPSVFVFEIVSTFVDFCFAAIFPNQEEKTQKFLLFMTCFFAWLSPTWLKGIITPVTERDQCWALIKVATGGPEESSSSCL